MEITQLEQGLLGNLWRSSDLWDNLTYLCDACNGRFAGTPDERRAGDYILSRFQKYGLANVAAESFEMRGWQRGAAHLSLLSGDQPIELPCIALPGSLGCSLEAEIIDLGPGAPADFQRPGCRDGRWMRCGPGRRDVRHAWEGQTDHQRLKCPRIEPQVQP